MEMFVSAHWDLLNTEHIRLISLSLFPGFLIFQLPARNSTSSYPAKQPIYSCHSHKLIPSIKRLFEVFDNEFLINLHIH